MALERGNQEPISDWEKVEGRLRGLGVDPDGLQEQFILGSGKGGQHVNRNATTVQLTDPRSGVSVKCGSERSQYLNRLFARKRLCESLESRREELRKTRDAARAKARFQKRKPSANQKRKREAGKRARGETKQLRRRPSRDD